MAQYPDHSVLLGILRELNEKQKTALSDRNMAVMTVDIDQLTADYKAFGWSEKATGALMAVGLLGSIAQQSGDAHLIWFMHNLAPTALARLIGDWGFPEAPK